MTERLFRARPRPPAFFGGLAFLAACSSAGTGTVGVSHPTLIEVTPERFLNGVRCSDEAGAMRRYVATLFDVTDEGSGGAGGAESQPPESGPVEAGGFAHPSSLPTDCRAAVGFGFVADGRRYRAEVDGYETLELTPRGSGTRQMLDPDGKPLAPRWGMNCASVVASAERIVPAWDCSPRALPGAPPGPAAPGRLTLATSGLLGDERCGDSEGQVERLLITLSVPGEEDARTSEVACGEDAGFDALPAGRTVTAYVSAFTFGSTTAFAGATCQAVTAEGVTTRATCSPLNSLGSLQVDFSSALAVLGVRCDAALANVEIAVPGVANARSFPPPDCLVPFSQSFKAGPAAVTLTATPRQGAAPPALLCTGTVQPGRSVLADCAPK